MGSDDRSHVGAEMGHNIRMTIGPTLEILLGMCDKVGDEPG